MSEIMSRLRADQIAARKASDKDRTLVLGTVLAALKNLEIDRPDGLTDDDSVQVLRKQIKQRQDAAEQYGAAGRPELVAREEYEIGVLKGYLPAELDPAVIRAAAQELLAGGATDLGRLMGALMGRFKGQADGKVINQIAREVLQG